MAGITGAKQRYLVRSEFALSLRLEESGRVVSSHIHALAHRWAIDNKDYHGRVDSLRHAFAQIAAASGKAEADGEVVRETWRRLLPGATEEGSGMKGWGPSRRSAELQLLAR